MTYIVSLAEDLDFSHSTDLIRSVHYMMMKHDLGARPGRWRSGPAYVWSAQSERTVYDGPPSSAVVELTTELVGWMNGPGADLPPLIRGAMAHLNLVMIHPFKDGNGPMSRALQSLVLARNDIIAPEFSSIEEYLGRNTPAYYDVLAQVGQGEWNPAGDARPWLRFVLTAHYHQAITVHHRMTETRETWTAVAGAVERAGLDERMVYAVYLSAVGRRVRRADHIEFSEVSERVASSDLKRLVDADLLGAVGEKRGRHYVASAAVKNMRNAVRQPREVITDPFLR
jgi:Fic family protein